MEYYLVRVVRIEDDTTVYNLVKADCKKEALKKIEDKLNDAEKFLIIVQNTII